MLQDNMPNFFIVGAAKAGTSSLYHYLKQHHQVFLTSEKEPHFFDNNMLYQKGLDYYLNTHFNGADSYIARGEATPAYLRLYNTVVPRMDNVFQEKKPKILIVLRDPVKRAWSHYLHRVRNVVECETFEKALEFEESRLKTDPRSWCGYYHDGLYSKQIEFWLDSFPKDKFHFILNDDLESKPQDVMKNVFSFLGVNTSVDVYVGEKRNVASAAKSKWLMKFLSQPSSIKIPLKLLLPYSTRRSISVYLRRKNLRPFDTVPILNKTTEIELRKKYDPEISRLEKIINRDLSMWRL